MDCFCDVDGNCGQHYEGDAAYWTRALGLTPAPYDARSAYDADDYKGRYTYGWQEAVA